MATKLRGGLRLRVALSFLALSVTLIAVQTVAVFLVTEGQEDEFIDQILIDEFNLLMREGAGSERYHHHTGLEIYRLAPGTPDSGLPAPLRGLAQGLHEVWLEDVEHHTLVREVDGERFVLTYDATPHERRIDAFRNYLLAGIVATGLLAVFAAFWLSRALSGQVTDLAFHVAGLDPSAPRPLQPLSGLYRDVEVVTLAAAFDAYSARVAELLDREKAFTADVSHELRSPLTAIRTGCEMLAADPGLSARSRERVERIVESVQRMVATIEALLFLAREIPVDDQEPVNLLELLRETAAPIAAGAPQVALVLDVPASAIVRAYRPAIELVVDNLLRNAYTHTDQGEVRVGFDGRQLTVSDTGVGIAAEDLPHLFERRFRGRAPRGQGSGLGLAIVKRVTERFGWAVGVDSVEGRGSSFRVVFPFAS
jgi:hypothetical protein